MRRPGPRPISAALEDALGAVRPGGLLAAVQSAWPAVAGPALSGAASPVSEREGSVTVACESAVWAHELELLGPNLTVRLNEGLADRGGGLRLERLRFVVGSAPNRG